MHRGSNLYFPPSETIIPFLPLAGFRCYTSFVMVNEDLVDSRARTSHPNGWERLRVTMINDRGSILKTNRPSLLPIKLFVRGVVSAFISEYRRFTFAAMREIVGKIFNSGL